MNWNDTKQHIRECVLADIENGYLVRKPHAKRVWRSVLLAPSVREDILVLAWDKGGWASDDDIHDYAHEFADSAEWVIYTAKARALWADSFEISDYEDAYGYNGGDGSIDDQITTCVYLATRDAVYAAVEDIRNEMEA